ncbi:hypothetical protein NFHSH190041_34310 [Shewanella sp. NFH-SH190041]|uniref:hypothetical protein n=1 Tax=Shewanella sp. NFH-SH190041 TaxID=2950245 RepID=UPI0021C33356|nr:hypothetical protein [Shewanella sp. NFH-SH190041]BDM65979.1 hypothetical protein NFHSH190041_34310 [Shewanella sp. NFH-SH190041]
MIKENMKFLLYIALVGFAFAAGTEVSQTNFSIWKYAKDLLSIAFGAGTLFIAYSALSTWKQQHRHTERYKAIIELISSTENVINEIIKIQTDIEVKFGKDNIDITLEGVELDKQYYALATAFLNETMKQNTTSYYLTDKQKKVYIKCHAECIISRNNLNLNNVDSLKSILASDYLIQLEAALDAYNEKLARLILMQKELLG